MLVDARGIHSYTYLCTYYVHTGYDIESILSQQCCLQRLQQLRAPGFSTNRVQATHLLEKPQVGWYCRESKNSPMACRNYLLGSGSAGYQPSKQQYGFEICVHGRLLYKAAKYESRAFAPSPGFSISSGHRSETHVGKSSTGKHGHRLGYSGPWHCAHEFSINRINRGACTCLDKVRGSRTSSSQGTTRAIPPALLAFP